METKTIMVAILAIGILILLSGLRECFKREKELEKEIEQKRKLQNLLDIKRYELRDMSKKYNKAQSELEKYICDVQEEDVVSLVIFNKVSERYSYHFGRVIDIDKNTGYLVLEDWTSTEYINDVEYSFEDIDTIFRCSEIQLTKSISERSNYYDE